MGKDRARDEYINTERLPDKCRSILGLIFGKLDLLREAIEVFRGGAIGKVDATFPFTDGLAADAEFLAEVGLGQVHMLAEGLDGGLVPEDGAVLLFDVVLGLEFLEGNGLGREIDLCDVVARLYPGSGLDGAFTVAVTPPGTGFVGFWGEIAVDELGDRFDREGDLGLGDRLEVLEEAIVFAAGFHWGDRSVV